MLRSWCNASGVSFDATTCPRNKLDLKDFADASHQSRFEEYHMNVIYRESSLLRGLTMKYVIINASCITFTGILLDVNYVLGT